MNLRAAERWMSLSRHPNVRACHYAEVVDGDLRVHAEHVDGAPASRSSPDRALDIVIQTAWGVGHAHRHGVAHGDIRPANVLVTADGTVKVTGFGVAEAADRRADVTGIVSLLRELDGPVLPGTIVDMAGLTAALIELHQQECGRPYSRPAPEPLPRTSDELTDHALVLTALGRTGDALSAYAQALILHPGHPEATYNEGLLRWRTGALTDDRLLTAIEAIGAGNPPWQGDYLRGLVHLERGDAPSALPLLLKATQAAGDNIEIKTAFQYAVKADRPHRLQPRTIQVRRGIRSDSLHVGPGPEVDHVRLSADGQIAVTAGNETVQAWDTRSGRCLMETQEHAAKASALHLSADGRYVLSGARTGVVVWRRIADGKRLHRLQTDDWVIDVWAAADARTAVITVRGRIQLWDLHEGRMLRAIDHDGPILRAAVSADGRRAVSAGPDHVLRVWDLPTGRCLARLDGHTTHVHAIRLSDDGRTAVTSGSYDPVIRVWDLDAGQCRHRLGGHVTEARGLDISADGRYALSGGGTDHTVRLWDLESGRCLRTFASDYDETAALSADARVAAAGGMSGQVRIWDVAAPTGYTAPAQPCRPRSFAEARALATTASVTLDGAEQAIAEQRFGTAHDLLVQLRTDRHHDRTPRLVRAWQRLSARVDRVGVEDVLVARTLGGHTDRVESICATPDSRSAVSGGRDGTLRVWDLESGECLRILTGHTGSVLSVAAGGDGRTVVSAGRDKTVRVWDLDSGLCVRTLTGHNSLVYAVAVSADGRRAVSGARDGDRLLVWDLDSGERIHRLDGHTGGVPTVAMTADGRLALSGSHDGTARMWDLDTGECLRVLDDSHRGQAVDVVRISADSRRALTVGSGGRARWWDLASGDCLHTFEPAWSRLTDAQLSSDGRYVLAAGEGLLKLYDLTTGEPVYELPERPEQIAAAGLSPDGRFVAVAARDTTVRTWDLTWRLQVP
ncbi:tetratricopeptide repeat protein [Actinoplanes sp. HUAS TT8]|uniref:tetratricopeptide repeat protein n=1 Tax=Actinoplanes sp. HUAS TT8 TaxID=3447453 RepID=UPI003F51FCBD